MNIEILTGNIDSLKIPIGYKKFLFNLLSHRSVNFYMSGLALSHRTVFKGLPQGSVLALSCLTFTLKIFCSLCIMNVIRYNSRTTLLFSPEVLKWMKSCSVFDWEKVSAHQCALSSHQHWVSSMGCTE